MMKPRCLAGRRSFTRNARPWTPQEIFRTGNVLGAWYDPSDLSTLFQDAAGNVPVTASGQQVGRMLDKSGNGLHLTYQGADGTRPQYVTDGIKSWLSFDGLDDVLLRQSAPFVRSGLPILFAMAMKANRVGTTGDQRYFAEGASTTAQPVYLFQSNSTAALSMYIRNTVSELLNTSVGPVAYNMVRRVVGFFDTLTNVQFRLDGAPVGDAPYARSGNFAQLDRMSIGAMVRTSTTSFSAFKFHGCVIVADADAQKHARNLDTYLFTKI